MTDSSTYAGAANSEELALSDLWNVLLRHKAIVLLSVLVCFAVGIFLSLSPRKYMADSMLRVQPGVTNEYRSPGTPAPSTEATDPFGSYVDILQSRTLLLKVAKDLDLANNPAFGGRAGGSESIDNPNVRARVLGVMRGQIAVAHKPKDEIIRVTSTTTSPALSAKLVNTLINDYVEYLFQTRYGASKRASGWLVGQLDDLKQQVEHDQTALTGLQAKLGIIGLNETGNDYLFAQSLGSMSKAASDATIERIVAEAKYRFLQESDPGLIEGEVNLLSGAAGGGGGGTGNLLQSLRSAQTTQASTYARLLAQFGPNYPEVKEQKAQLDETTRQVTAEESRILNQAKLSYSAASANEQMTERALSSKQGEAFSQRGDMVKYIILLHDYEAHRTLYESLISRLQEAGITAGLEGGEIDIVDLADVPTHPAPPGRLTYWVGSILAGLFLGFLLALIAEAVSTRVVTPDQARRASSFPSLGVLPNMRRARTFADTLTDTPYMEALDAVRASLFSLGVTSPPTKVLLVTSAVPSEGKSTTALHLAGVLAQHQARVLLIDCDLRRGTLASKLDLPSTPGLGDVLVGGASFDDTIRPVLSVPGLQVLVSGPRPDVRAAVLLDSPRMRSLLASAKEKFDFIILNSPPTLGLSDALNLGQIVDGTILVIRNGVTDRKTLKRAEAVLRGASVPVLGYVLNDVSLGSQGFAYRGYRRMYSSDAKGTA